MILLFPLNSEPNSIVPEMSAICAAFVGFLASNNSATRGRPPVISFVLVVSLCTFERGEPTSTLSPSFTIMLAPTCSL